MSPGTPYLAQRASTTSALAHYKQLLQLRQRYSQQLAQATTQFNAIADEQLFELIRETTDERLIIRVNLSNTPLVVTPSADTTTLFNNGFDPSNQQLAPFGVLILKEEL